MWTGLALNPQTISLGRSRIFRLLHKRTETGTENHFLYPYYIKDYIPRGSAEEILQTKCFTEPSLPPDESLPSRVRDTLKLVRQSTQVLFKNLAEST